jgi:predicted acylesterase/phospholipase RssA
MGDLKKTALLIAPLALAALACSTLDIVRAFNTGSHGTIGDPTVTPTVGQSSLLARRIVDEMSGAYFGDGGALALWFDYAGRTFPEIVRRPFESTPDAGSIHERSVQHFKSAGMRGRYADVEKLVRDQFPDAPWITGNIAKGPGFLCDGRALTLGAKDLADQVRFLVSLGRAVQTARAWYDEGLVDDASLAAGSRDGFRQAADYLRHRRFHREVDRANIGIVISGGGSNGMYSAGAVWTLLNLIDGCLSSPDTCKTDPRFRLISGTSAGAMIATVVDMFNSAWEDDRGQLRHASRAGQPVLNKLAQWFTCLPAQQLYCVENDSTISIFAHRVGLVDFDGARWLLSKNVTRREVDNTSELLLNTVDFQSGALLAESDQNPADTPGDAAGPCAVVNHALSSIPEPFIANPIRQDAGAGKPGQGFYLDGGVRSVVPLMPLIRHGADRVVIVSSGASVVEGSTPPAQGLDILQRFIAISVGANGEEGIGLGEAFAALQASREEELCLSLLGGGGADPRRDAFCTGAFRDACSASSAPPRREDYPVAAVYRGEARAPEAAGYSFDPRQSLPLFLAGMAAVRERCAKFAAFLGDLPPADAERWCNSPMPTVAICDDPLIQWPLKQYKYSPKDPRTNPPETVRACDPAIWKDDLPACP